MWSGGGTKMDRHEIQQPPPMPMNQQGNPRFRELASDRPVSQFQKPRFSKSLEGENHDYQRTSYGKQEGRQKLLSVKIEGLALLKIMKHCTESLPDFCAGSLLGLDIDKKLEVTNCFPFPQTDQDETDGTEYQLEMMKLLRDVNVDNNCVGWYRSSNMGSFCSSDLVEQQFNYQEMLDQGDTMSKSIVLIFDPFQTKEGNLALKAYRLSDEFVNMYRSRKGGTFTAPNVLNDADAKDPASKVSAFLEEIPVEVSNSDFVHVYLRDVEESRGENINVEPDRLDLSTNAFLEKNLEFLVDEVDNLEAEQHKMQYYQRQLHKQQQQQQKWLAQRRLENKTREDRGEAPLPEEGDPNNPIFKPLVNPSKLESLLIRNQIGIYCEQVNKFAGSSFSKLFLASSIQKERA